MLTPTPPKPEPTPLELTYLDALRDGKKLGKQMRGRLRRWGVRGSKGAFYGVMKRLMDNGLVRSERAPRSKGPYRGPERYYELTDAGCDAFGPKLELVKDDDSRRADEECRKEIERARACLR